MLAHRYGRSNEGGSQPLAQVPSGGASLFCWEGSAYWITSPRGSAITIWYGEPKTSFCVRLRVPSAHGLACHTRQSCFGATANEWNSEFAHVKHITNAVNIRAFMHFGNVCMKPAKEGFHGKQPTQGRIAFGEHSPYAVGARHRLLRTS